MKQTKKDLIYLYCVTNYAPKLKEAGNLADKLSFVHYRGLYALISKVSEDEFGEESLKKNFADLEWIKVKAGIHEKIIEEIMKNTCVIPFKFGTVFNTENNLKAMLEKYAKVLRANLRNLEGKEEWGLKIYCDMEKIKRNIREEDGEILKVEKEISSSPPGKAYFLKKKKEELIKDALNGRINKYGQETFELLEGLSFAGQINKLLPKEVTGRKDDMILNVAFLVNNNKVAQFIQAEDGLKAKYHDKGLNFDCTGPWPPYNFCQTQMNTDENRR